jgi:hypothetical protein
MRSFFSPATTRNVPGAGCACGDAAARSVAGIVCNDSSSRGDFVPDRAAMQPPVSGSLMYEWDPAVATAGSREFAYE